MCSYMPHSKHFAKPNNLGWGDCNHREPFNSTKRYIENPRSGPRNKETYRSDGKHPSHTKKGLIFEF